MKAFIPILLVLGLALGALAGCTVPAFVGTEIPAETTAAVAESANGSHTDVTGLYIDYTLGAGNVDITNTVVAGTTTKQWVTITVHNGNVDADSLTGVYFYNLTATAATDGGHTRGTAITPASSSIEYQGANLSILRYSFDMSTAASFSNLIELYIDPAVLTANGGNKKLDIDTQYMTDTFGSAMNEMIQGESPDDAVVYYITVTGGGVAAAGADGDPRLQGTALFPTPPLPGAASVTTLNSSYPLVAADSSDMKTTFEAAYQLQKFDGSAWATVTYTSTYSTTTGAWVITIPATAALENYRWVILNPATLTSGKTINGYTAKLASWGDLASVKLSGPTSTGDTTTPSYNLGAGYTVNSYFDADDYNGTVNITVTLSGSEGLSGVSTDTVLLYDASNKKYVPVSSITVTGAANNIMLVTLDPAYEATGGTLQLQISPSVLDLGATTATTDDLKLGDYTNCTVQPFGWDIVTTGANI